MKGAKCCPIDKSKGGRRSRARVAIVADGSHPSEPKYLKRRF